MDVLTGIAASPGLARGRAVVYRVPELAIPKGRIAKETEAAEMAAFMAGRERTQAQLEALRDHVEETLGEDEAGIFEGHIEILMDEELERQIRAAIVDEALPALAAIKKIIDEQREEFLALEDEYLRARADDIADIGRRLLYAVEGIPLMDLGALPANTILVARDLTPSETAQLNKENVVAFVVETGGRTSHSAIMARTMEIPAVVGCVGALEAIANGASLCVDGDEGRITIEPDATTIAAFDASIARNEAERRELLAIVDLPSETKDGHAVELAVNIGNSADAEAALRWKPDGVGLFRSEFLFMDRPRLPDEEEQYRAYAAAGRAFADKSVILRTLDIGGDKPIPAVTFGKEENPFLGWRGARLCLDRRDILRTQLRAILRASATSHLKIMYPMISSLEEVEKLEERLEEAKESLRGEGLPFNESIPVGIMVETPAAALMADALASRLDFFSIGSNDLTQYALAADRGNEKVAACYQPFHPAVFKLIALTIEAGHRRGIPTGICGELGGMEDAALPLLGLKLDEFSMSAPTLPRIKRILRAATMADAEEAAGKVLAATTAEEAREAAAKIRHRVLARE